MKYTHRQQASCQNFWDYKGILFNDGYRPIAISPFLDCFAGIKPVPYLAKILRDNARRSFPRNAGSSPAGRGNSVAGYYRRRE